MTRPNPGDSNLVGLGVLIKKKKNSPGDGIFQPGLKNTEIGNGDWQVLLTGATYWESLILKQDAVFQTVSILPTPSNMPFSSAPHRKPGPEPARGRLAAISNSPEPLSASSVPRQEVAPCSHGRVVGRVEQRMLCDRSLFGEVPAGMGRTFFPDPNLSLAWYTYHDIYLESLKTSKKKSKRGLALLGIRTFR